MKTAFSPTSLGFPQVGHHAAHELITWHPRGLLDDALMDEIAAFAQEQIDTRAHFDRYTDFSGLTEIRLQIGHVFKVAEARSSAHADFAPVKSAFFCDKFVGLGIARLYETLMEGSTIQVRVFSDRRAAAEWLGVPLESLFGDGMQGPQM